MGRQRLQNQYFQKNQIKNCDTLSTLIYLITQIQLLYSKDPHRGLSMQSPTQSASSFSICNCSAPLKEGIQESLRGENRISESQDFKIRRYKQ